MSHCELLLKYPKCIAALFNSYNCVLNSQEFAGVKLLQKNRKRKDDSTNAVPTLQNFELRTGTTLQAIIEKRGVIFIF